MNVCISPMGLYLSVLPIFRVGHPPLLIPWREIQVIQKRFSIFGSRTAVSIGIPEVAAVVLPDKIILEMKKYLEPARHGQ